MQGDRANSADCAGTYLSMIDPLVTRTFMKVRHFRFSIGMLMLIGLLVTMFAPSAQSAPPISGTPNATLVC